MFRDLYDAVTLLFSWRWPKAEGEITAVRVDSGTDRLRLLVDYVFPLGKDESYTGEARWPNWFSIGRAENISQRLRVGQPVTVRYRRDNPSVNRLDRSVWQDVEGI